MSIKNYTRFYSQLCTILARFKSLRLQYRVALLILAISILWLSSSLFYNNKSPIEEDTVKTVQVQLVESKAQKRTVYLFLTGTTDAQYSIDLMPKVNGEVVDICVSDGDKVNKGDVILKLKEYDYPEQHEKAKALVKQREVEYNASESLNEEGYMSQTQAAAAFAAMQSAKADLKRSQINLENTVIATPLSGYIDRITVSKGDLVVTNKPIATVINFDSITIVTYVSEKDIKKVKLGNIAKVNLINGYQTEGKVSFISRIIQPTTRTYRLEVAVPQNNYEMFVTKGMTADIQLAIDTIIAHKVPASTLILNDDGIIGVKIVDQDNTVSFLPIEIIDEEKDGILIFGIPETVKLITSGHYFVNAGDKVK